MKCITLALIMTSVVPGNPVGAQQVQIQSKLPEQANEYAGNPPQAPKRTASQTIERSEKNRQTVHRKEKVREALLPLLRGVFNTHWESQEVLLTIDAGWRNDSLSIEYKYYRGSNVLALNENMLIEKIYFTVRPEEIDELDTEKDEFLFLYLRNTGKKRNINQLVSRPGAGENEENWRSCLGVPVRAENLQMIIQYLKDLRMAD